MMKVLKRVGAVAIVSLALVGLLYLSGVSAVSFVKETFPTATPEPTTTPYPTYTPQPTYTPYPVPEVKDFEWEDRTPNNDGIYVGEQYLMSVHIQAIKEVELLDGETQIMMLGVDKDKHVFQLVCTTGCEDVVAGYVTDFRLSYAQARNGYNIFSVIEVLRKNYTTIWSSGSQDSNLYSGA